MVAHLGRGSSWKVAQVEPEAKDAANILQSAGQPPMTKHDPAPNVSNAEAGKSCAEQNVPSEWESVDEVSKFLSEQMGQEARDGALPSRPRKMPTRFLYASAEAVFRPTPNTPPY